MKDRSSHCDMRSGIRSALLLVLSFAAASAVADIRLSVGYVYPFPYYAPYLDGWYGYGPCYPYGACISYGQFQAWERRRERERALARPPQTPPPMGIEAWHGWPGNAMHRMPQGDPANATPEYGAAGRVREEFERSGEFLPEFLEGSVRPR